MNAQITLDWFGWCARFVGTNPYIIEGRVFGRIESDKIINQYAINCKFHAAEKLAWP